MADQNEKPKIRVLIVEDSPLMREAIKCILVSDPGIEVIGMAGDGAEGYAMALKLKPDVITMDLKMPVMDGIETIKMIMGEFPTPIIVVSSIDVSVVVTALGIGAMDFVAITNDLETLARELVDKVRVAYKVQPLRHVRERPINAAKEKTGKGVSRVIAVGVSTGGPQALEVLLAHLPVDLNAAVIIVQHIAAGFIEGLAEWLRCRSSLRVKAAKAGDVLENGVVFLAPDSYNIQIEKDGKIVLHEDNETSDGGHFLPSIDAMMESVAERFGRRAVGVIMTGMGRDGVKGMAAIHRSGGYTIAQNEETSVIFGMNRIAIELGHVDRVVALEKIADEIVSALGGGRKNG